MLVAAAASNGGNPMRLLYVVLAALLVTSDAQADTLTGSYSGFVFATPARQYFDLGNFFGFGANANLAGLPISGTFSYDPSGRVLACVFSAGGDGGRKSPEQLSTPTCDEKP
jgi:hypothetical protein